MSYTYAGGPHWWSRENYWAIFTVEPNTLVIRNPKTGRYSIVGVFSGRGYGDDYTWVANKDFYQSLC